MEGCQEHHKEEQKVFQMHVLLYEQRSKGSIVPVQYDNGKLGSMNKGTLDLYNSHLSLFRKGRKGCNSRLLFNWKWEYLFKKPQGETYHVV